MYDQKYSEKSVDTEKKSIRPMTIQSYKSATTLFQLAIITLLPGYIDLVDFDCS